jgi:hypothetical protein
MRTVLHIPLVRMASPSLTQRVTWLAHQPIYKQGKRAGVCKGSPGC